MRLFSVSTRIGAGIAALTAAGFMLSGATCAPSASSAAKDVSNRTQAPLPVSGTGVQHVITVTAVRAPAVPERYTVISGDTLSAIAGKTEGSTACWPGIYRANSGQVKDPNLIYAGQNLQVPAGCDSRTVSYASASPSGAGNADREPDGDGDEPVAQPSGGGTQVVSAPQPVTQGGGYAVTSSFQACVIRAESGGNPYIWNASGHWGLYQFSYGTWIAHGGAGYLFGKAGPAYQTQIFWNTVQQDGTSDWAPYDGCLRASLPSVVHWAGTQHTQQEGTKWTKRTATHSSSAATRPSTRARLRSGARSRCAPSSWASWR